MAGSEDRQLIVDEHMSEVLDTNKSLSQQLSKGKRKARRLEKEVEELKKALHEKTLALDMMERKLHQAKRQAKEQHALQLKKDQERKDAIKKAEDLQEQLAQLQNGNLSLHQQLGDVQKITQEQMRTERQLEGELADVFRKHWVAETSLKASEHQCNYLKQENSDLQEDLDRATVKVCDLSAQLEVEFERSLQLKVTNEELRGLVVLLEHCLVTPGVGHTTILHEHPAHKEMRDKQYLSLLLQAAAQGRKKEANTTNASSRKQQEQRDRPLDSSLETGKSMQEEIAQLLAYVEAEIKSSKKRSQEIRRCLTKTF
ncbi:uncharacterized protein VSU04_005405 isoform 2-T2 [Chlamydotis macqueenii]